MREIRELYGQTWSLYGGSRSFLFGGILAIFLGAITSVTPFIVIMPLFLLYTALHAGIQYRVLTMKHKELDEKMRVALMVRAARLWFFFVGCTLANILLEIYIRNFQQAA